MRRIIVICDQKSNMSGEINGKDIMERKNLVVRYMCMQYRKCKILRDKIFILSFNNCRFKTQREERAGGVEAEQDLCADRRWNFSECVPG